MTYSFPDGCLKVFPQWAGMHHRLTYLGQTDQKTLLLYYIHWMILTYLQRLNAVDVNYIDLQSYSVGHLDSWHQQQPWKRTEMASFLGYIPKFQWFDQNYDNITICLSKHCRLLIKIFTHSKCLGGNKLIPISYIWNDTRYRQGDHRSRYVRHTCICYESEGILLLYIVHISISFSIGQNLQHTHPYMP